MERLFFAVWPDGETAKRLAGLARELADTVGGKPVPVAKIHLTIAFLGSPAPDRAASPREAGAPGRAGPSALDLHRVGSFRSAPGAWAGGGSASRGRVRGRR